MLRDGYELHRDGPYLSVVLPDVLPTDWEALRRELDDEIDEGTTRVTVVAADDGLIGTLGEPLDRLVATLHAQGVEALVVRQEEPAAFV